MKTHQLAPGTVLGRYELLMPIASGGMATVWVARSRGSRGFSKTVAIKTILPNLSDDPTFEQMFLDEAAIASKIQHPNVAQIIDLGEQDEVLYLAMEWVDGESLSTLTKFARKNGTDIPLRVGLKTISQACAGIHAAHELRDDDDRLLELVHRDVSPQNILLSSSGVVKLVDFGVAKALGRSGETSAGQLKGKVPFMSPEQAKGGKVDRRTDIFALGIILYRIATGSHPFIDETDIKTMRNIISRPVMPPRVKTPSVPVELERTILRALQKDPDKRHATAAELEIELEQVMASTTGPVTIDEVSTFVRATLGERDRKRRAAIRDAAMKMDDSSNHPTIVGATMPMDSVSGVMLTQTQTPPSSISTVEVVSSPSSPSSARITPPKPVSADGALTVKATNGEANPDGEVTRAYDMNQALQALGPGAPAPREAMRSDPVIGSSPTLAALSGPASWNGVTPTHVPAPAKRTKAVAIAAAVACGVGAGILLIAKLGSSSAPDASAAPPKSPTALEERAPTGASGGVSGSTTEGTAARAAAPTNGGGTELDVNALPDSTSAPTADTAKVVAGGVRRPGPLPVVPPATAPISRPTTSPTARVDPPPPPTKPTSKPTSNVPTVQDPGF